MITYTYNSHTNILEVVFDGHISPSVIFDFMTAVNRDKDLPSVLYSLVDARTATFIFEPQDIQNLVKLNFHMDKRFKKINNAILSNDQNAVALLVFKQYAEGSSNFNVEIFNNDIDAKRWFKLK